MEFKRIIVPTEEKVVVSGTKQKIETSSEGKFINKIKIDPIPYYEVGNAEGGNTVIIG